MFRNIVWATDGSPHADRAFEFARDLARQEGATLHVTHVVEKLVGVRLAGQNAYLDEPNIQAKIKQQASDAAAGGVEVKLHMPFGHIGEIAPLISDVAGANHADLIVVGTHGHSATVAAVVGSVTQRLLHITGCPVLAVPPDRAAPHRDAAADTVGAER